MILLDTNALVYAINIDAPQHHMSQALIQAALDGEVAAVLVPQVLVEFLAVVTNPRRVQQPLAPARAWEVVTTLRMSLPVLDLQPAALGILGELLRTRFIAGRNTFDLFLAAQMRSHGVSTICTYNQADFAQLPGIQALTPEEILGGLENR